MARTSNFEKRRLVYENELKALYTEVYKDNGFCDLEESYNQLIEVMASYYKTRKPSYKKEDTSRANWYHSNKIVGTTLYVDLFSKDIKNFDKHIDYFKELGITLIHFMPILEGRADENDGGYAVKDYKNIDPKFGTMKDFQSLIALLRKNGIHSCIDFVVNHTAMEHEFAVKAYQGEKKYQDMYFMYSDDTIPKKFDETVPEVFPGVAPGNFTYYKDIEQWVFTSFYPFQWDLNYQNPFVFERVVDILLYLANIGVDMIRLDAIPFMWKAIGHTCRNHPMIHKLLRMMKLITEIVCPAVALLGEAIVEPEEIIGYFGRENKECDLMYNATRMVNIWNAIATRDARLLQIDDNRLKAPEGGSWINYVRCHDDIGWGFNEEATSAMGFDPFLHKQFLIHFYKGDYEGSFAIGDLYEFHEDTLDARNCGTQASLCGLEKALVNNDQYQRELAIKRIQMMNGLIVGAKGLPLIYSGDEVAMLNDYSYLKDEHKAHDSRWLHRPFFDHKKALNRTMNGTYHYEVFQHLKYLISLRKNYDVFMAESDVDYIDTWNKHIYCATHRINGQRMIQLYNFSEDRQFVSTVPLNFIGHGAVLKDIITGKMVDLSKENLLMGPYEFMWLM